MYNEFAYIYDELMQDVDYEDWYLYIENLFRKFNKKPHNILEMACGTGNLSYYLAKSGYNLTCFDLSNDMLSMAYNKLGNFKNVKILNQNMIDFNINKEFDAIISICDSINYILDEKDLLQTFNNVRRHLSKDGIFIFDINSHYKLKYIIGNNTFIEEGEDVYYIWQNFFQDKENIAEFYITFFTKDVDGKYIRFEEEHMERAYYIEEILQLLKTSNFNEIHLYGDLSFEKPQEKSERITIIAMA
ncbi:MAG: class I SAM-dependent methyltransferase [Tissierellia bacterium]|nr:class I SAM-dependent methyltransferase [Tissierellia bacterium]